MLKTSTKSPKYIQISKTLNELAATLKPGDRFPSHTEIIARFGVSDTTALRALDELRREGRIVRRNGVGTFVADRSAVTGDSSTVQPVIAAVALSSDAFFQSCIHSLTTEAAQTGKSVVCHYSDNKATFGDALPLENLRPQGFLIFSYYLVSVATALRERGHRVVLVGVPPADVIPTLPCVFSDHDYGATLVVKRLLDLGHRRIAFAHIYYDVPPTRRWQGHVRALRAAKTGTDPELRIGPAEIAGWREDPKAAARYFAQPDAPTALVAWNDDEAMRLYGILRLAGIRIPEDVSIVGYDNLPMGAEAHPPLDTVDQHIPVQITHALALLNGNQETSSMIAIPTLIPRGSCAAPPIR